MSTPRTHLALTEPGRRHLLEQVVSFTRHLRGAGFAASPAELVDLCRCLDHIDIGRREELHAAARAALIRDQADIERFDAWFHAFWSADPLPPPPPPAPGDPQAAGRDSDGERQTTPVRPRPLAQPMDREPPEEGDPDAPPGASLDSSLEHRDIRSMTEFERARAHHLARELITRTANRPSRRMRPSGRRGQPDLRRMLRRNALRIPDDTELAFRDRRRDRTRLRVLCDVSGSMERYSRFFIPLLFALRGPRVDLKVAVFSTELTIITDELRRGPMTGASGNPGGQVAGWGGGTDLGRSLEEFNDRVMRGSARSSTTAVILSDGWDCGDADRLRSEMRRLRRHAGRVLWLNPLAGSREFEPTCQGMRVAMPFVDDLLPAHNVASLLAAVRWLRRSRR